MKWLVRKRMIFGFMGAILMAFGCSKKSDNGPGAPDVSNGLMPLSVGNYWNYSKVDYDSATGLPEDTVGDAINILAEIELDTTTYFRQNQTSVYIDGPSFFLNVDSNTLDKVDSAVQYTFFKRVKTDSVLVDEWADTVTSRCKGHNLLVGYTDNPTIDGYSCLHNEVQVTDCTGFAFEKWEYYLKPGLGLVRIQLYKSISGGGYFLQFSEDLTNYRTQ